MSVTTSAIGKLFSKKQGKMDAIYLILILLLRPNGLFGEKQITKV